MTLRERVVRLGGDRGRVGILTRDGGRSGVSVALLNAGWLHHVGPNRLHVHLARALGEEGHEVFRFDFSGIGDSPPRTDGLPRPEANLLEGVEAVDLLASGDRGGEIVVGGLCSGADAAFRIALEDERVTGAVFLDGFPYRTPGWYLRHYGRRIFRLSSWRRLFAGAEEVRKSLDHAVASPVEGGRDIPPLNDAREGLKRLAERGTRLLFVYTGGMASFFNHERQFGETFPGLREHPRVSVRLLPDADHIFSFGLHQRRLLDILTEWLSGFRDVPGAGGGGA